MGFLEGNGDGPVLEVAIMTAEGEGTMHLCYRPKFILNHLKPKRIFFLDSGLI